MNTKELDILIEQMKQLGKNFDNEFPVSAGNIRKAAIELADLCDRLEKEKHLAGLWQARAEWLYPRWKAARADADKEHAKLVEVADLLHAADEDKKYLLERLHEQIELKDKFIASRDAYKADAERLAKMMMRMRKNFVTITEWDAALWDAALSSHEKLMEGQK